MLNGLAASGDCPVHCFRAIGMHCYFLIFFFSNSNKLPQLFCTELRLGFLAKFLQAVEALVEHPHYIAICKTAIKECGQVGV